MKPETMKLVLENSHAVAINMNDTFYYACADAAEISVSEIEDLEPIIDEYGDWAFVAYEAIRRGHDPMIPKYATNPKFVGAKAAVQEMMSKAEEYGELFELRSALKSKPHTPKERKRISQFLAKAKNWFSFFTHR